MESFLRFSWSFIEGNYRCACLRFSLFNSISPQNDDHLFNGYSYFAIIRSYFIILGNVTYFNRCHRPLKVQTYSRLRVCKYRRQERSSLRSSVTPTQPSFPCINVRKVIYYAGRRLQFGYRFPNASVPVSTPGKKFIMQAGDSNSAIVSEKNRE